MNNVPGNHIGVFQQLYKPRSSTSTVHCFYATKEGSAPIKPKDRWYLEINDGNDLLNQVTAILVYYASATK